MNKTDGKGRFTEDVNAKKIRNAAEDNEVKASFSQTAPVAKQVQGAKAGNKQPITAPDPETDDDEPGSHK